MIGCSTNEIALHAYGALLFGFAHLHVLDELAVSVRQAVGLAVGAGILDFQRKSLFEGVGY